MRCVAGRRPPLGRIGLLGARPPALEASRGREEAMSP